MKKTNAILILITNIILFVVMLLAMIFCLNSLEWYLQVLAYGCLSVFSLGTIIGFILKKEELFKSSFSLNVLTFVIIAFFSILNLAGIFSSLQDMDKVKQLIVDSGPWGYLVYGLISIANVVILPIPAVLFYLVGVALFGPWITFIIAYVTVLIGSFICFFIGRVCGKRVVNWCIGQDKADKYCKMLGAKGNVAFIIMQILPFFPDDVLCIVAGLTNMRLRFFSIVMFFVRPIYIALVCAFGTGNIIPFSGWGIPVWIAIIAITLVLFILFCKYQTQIENWLAKFKNKNKTQK